MCSPVGEAVRESDYGQANRVLATSLATALVCGFAAQAVLQVHWPCS